MKIDTKSIWKDSLEIMKVSVSSAIYSTWFSQTHLIKIHDTGTRFVVEVGCPTTYVKNFVETRYFGLIQDSISKVLGKPCDPIFIVKENPSKTTSSENKVLSPLFGSGDDKENLLAALQKAHIRPAYTFENFAVSSSNQMAHAAALAVSENLGSAYNPLFIWGGVGVGKTHLMGGVGNEAIKRNDKLKVLFCTSETFTNDIVEGIRNRTTPEVRNKYRKLDLLMIDDIQFIAGKDAAQEEFFHTFNAVTSSGGQIILTSDRPPGEIAKLEERLRSRFEAGLIVDIAPPNFELRCAIAQIKANERNIPLEMDQVQIIAANLDTARKIEGALIKLMTVVGNKKSEITNELVENIIGKGIETNKSVTLKDPSKIVDAVCRYYQIGKRAILGESRSRTIARPRQILMYLLRTDLRLPLEEVGRVVGGRDHTTVMHAVEKITQLAANDVQIREDMTKIKLGI